MGDILRGSSGTGSRVSNLLFLPLTLGEQEAYAAAQALPEPLRKPAHELLNLQIRNRIYAMDKTT